MNSLDRSMERYYEQRAQEYDDWYDRRGNYNNPATNSAWHAQVAELIREITRFSQGLPAGNVDRQTRILDLACGTGKWTPILARALNQSGRLVAYDLSPAMLVETYARLEYEERGLLEKTFFVRGNAYNLPFPDKTFDLVFFGFWLSHVPRERVLPFLEEVKRVLKPAGQILIYDSLLMPGKVADQIQQRSLNNGSIHDVLKIYYTAPELQALLSNLFSEAAAHQTRDFFVVGRAKL